MDWAALFEESYPVPGASEDELRRLAAAVSGPLPASYVALLGWSNGGEFRRGERWFQFFPALDPIHGVLAMRDGYEVPRYMPGALPFAFDGGGTFYLFDVRSPPVGGEYPVCRVHAGCLGWDEEDCARIADTFLAALRGSEDADQHP